MKKTCVNFLFFSELVGWTAFALLFAVAMSLCFAGGTFAVQEFFVNKNASIAWAVTVLPIMMFFSFGAVCVIFKKVGKTVANHKEATANISR